MVRKCYQGRAIVAADRVAQGPTQNTPELLGLLSRKQATWLGSKWQAVRICWFLVSQLRACAAAASLQPPLHATPCMVAVLMVLLEIAVDDNTSNKAT